MRASLASIFAGGLIAFAATASALSADLPVKAHPLPYEQASSWTGFYVGANIGYGWSASNQTATFTPGPNPPGGGLVGIAGAGAPISFSTSGVLGGFQMGHNWQVDRQWVLGLEADLDFTGVKGSGVSTNLSPVFIPFSSTADTRLDWLGTVRARVGYLPTNNLMLYATGGFAYGRVKQSVAYINESAGTPANFDGICPAGPGAAGTCYTGSSSRIATGWTVGAGFEHALMRNWTVRAEYLYVNLGGNSLSATVVGGVTAGFPPSMIGAQYNDLTLHILRAGINYRF